MIHQESDDSAIQSEDDPASENGSVQSEESKEGEEETQKLKSDSDKSNLNFDSRDQELIVVQENLYNIKINAPGVGTFEVQVDVHRVCMFF